MQSRRPEHNFRISLFVFDRIRHNDATTTRQTARLIVLMEIAQQVIEQGGVRKPLTLGVHRFRKKGFNLAESSFRAAIAFYVDQKWLVEETPKSGNYIITQHGLSEMFGFPSALKAPDERQQAIAAPPRAPKSSEPDPEATPEPSPQAAAPDDTNGGEPKHANPAAHLLNAFIEASARAGALPPPKNRKSWAEAAGHIKSVAQAATGIAEPSREAKAEAKEKLLAAIPRFFIEYNKPSWGNFAYWIADQTWGAPRERPHLTPLSSTPARPHDDHDDGHETAREADDAMLREKYQLPLPDLTTRKLPAPTAPALSSEEIEAVTH